MAEFFELEILTDSELLLINFESNLVITNLTDSLGGYQIFMQHSGVCDEWDTILGETAEYLILITNRCPVIGGDPYVVIDGVNVEFHDFILNYYVYDENDNDLLEHYGVEYYKNIEAQ